MWKYTALKRAVSDGRSHQHIPNSSRKIMRQMVHINSRGLRGREHSLSKPEGVYRILFLGDSITFGFGVKEEDIFVNVLERELNSQFASLPDQKRFELINAGIGNYNTKQEFAYLREEGFRYEPDEVVVMFYINDLEPTQKFANNWFTRNSFFYALIVSQLRRVFQIYFLHMNYESYYKNLYNERSIGEFNSLVRRMADFTGRHHFKLKAVLVPELHDLRHYSLGSEYEQVKSIFIQRRIPVLDLRLFFDSSIPSSEYWVARDDAHPNVRAHQVIAKAISEVFYNATTKIPVQ